MSRRSETNVAGDATPAFEAPELTVIGEATDVVLGIPWAGWDHRGLSEPTFEFESDDEQG